MATNHRPLSSLRSPLLWLLGSVPVLVMFITDYQSLDNGVVKYYETWGRDFANVWAGGKLVLAGRLDMLYDVEAYRSFEASLYGRPGVHNYSYPPIALFLNLPFALLPYGMALAAWLVGTGLLFVAAARPWMPGPARWLVVLTPAAMVNIWAGHYGFLIGALFLAGFRHLPERPRLAGLCFGLMAIKPHLAVLIPVVLMLRGEWRAIAAAALTVGLLVLASSAAFGADLWRQYLTVTASVQAGMIDPGREFYGLMATSLASGLLRQGVPHVVAYGLQGAAMFGVVLGIAMATVRRVDPRELALLAATGTFVLLPYAFNYDLTVVAIAALVTWSRADSTPAARTIAIVAFLAPQFGMLTTPMGVPLTPIALIALFCVQARPFVSLGPVGRAGAGAVRSA